ncbi:hypothetical protein ACFQX6_50735 [Streptosporangium lutulentum]
MAAQVYVARPPVETPTGRFLGLAHFQRMLREPPPPCSAASWTPPSTRSDPSSP